jgi:hypothetical protein
MSTPRSRLARLEARQSPTPDADPRIDRVSRMCNAPILLQLIDEVACDRFLRRTLAEDRYPYPCRGMRGGSLSALARGEVRELERFAAGDDVLGMIERWADEPDRLGWPTEGTGWPTGRALFWSRLPWYGKRSDEIRGGTYAAAWRSQHPSWRPGMSALGTIRWELRELLDMAAADVARMIPEGDGDA